MATFTVRQLSFNVELYFELNVKDQFHKALFNLWDQSSARKQIEEILHVFSLYRKSAEILF